MTGKKDKPVRPVRAKSMLDQRFTRLGARSKRTALPAHPAIVVLDLRRGSLRSLDLYLQQHTGPLDPAVARELSRLISGAASESRFRIVVVEHPDRPKDEGGRPKGITPERQEQDRKIVKRYDKRISLGDKRYLALQEVAKHLKVSQQTVRRALAEDRRARAEVEAKDRASEVRAEAEVKREQSLQALRDNHRSKD